MGTNIKESKMSQSDKMSVIDEAFKREAEKSDSPAAEMVTDWRAWYDGLTWYDRAVSPSALAEAETRFRALQVAYATSAPEVPPPPLPLLGKGTRGAAVRRLRQALGMTEVNGNFDAACEAALKEWQQKHGIEATGKTGPDTWAALGVRTVHSQRPPVMTSDATAQFGEETAYASLPTSTYAGYAEHVATYGSNTVGPGSKGQQVAAWQTIIGVKADGDFGPATTAATKKWQSAHGLTPDGVAGPASWAKASSVVAPKVAETLAVEAAKEKPFNVDLGSADAPGFAPAPVPAPVAVPVGFAKPLVAPKPKVQEAGIFSGLSNLSTPAKIGLGVATAAGIVYGISQQKKR